MEVKNKEHEYADNPFTYIPLLTLSEAWTETWGIFLFWGLSSMVGGGVSLAASWAGFDGHTSTAWFPKLSASTYFLIALVSVSWFGRGKTIHYRIPNLAWKSWLGAVALGLLIWLPFENVLPDWTWFPLRWGVFCIFIWLDNLNKKGYQKYLDASQDRLSNRF